MKRTYFCPKCESTLNPNVKIILAADSGSKKGLVLFSPQPGNYDAIIPADLGLSAESMVTFRCPVCGVELASPKNPNLAEIGFRFASGTRGLVHFSRRFGEQATFFVTEEWVRSYGQDAQTYGQANFFGAGRDLD